METEVFAVTDSFGVQVTICSNAELLCQNGILQETDNDRAGLAVDAARDVLTKVLHGYPDVDDRFSEWTGGQYARRHMTDEMPIRYTSPYIRPSFWVRYPDAESDEWVWKSCSSDALPPEIRERIGKAIAKADEVLRAIIDAPA